jgi:hypothetical protein
MINFVNALNSIRPMIWLVMISTLVVCLIYKRYSKTPPTGALLDQINGVHIAILGFALCLCGIALAVNGHEIFADKVFVSGASFIGGIGVGKMMSDKGQNANQVAASPNA